MFAHKRQTMHTHPIHITPRRLQIASLRAHGHGVKATAKILHIQPNTVNSHCDAILYGTDSLTFTQAVYKLAKQGLIGLVVGIFIATQCAGGDGLRRAGRGRGRTRTRIEQMV